MTFGRLESGCGGSYVTEGKEVKEAACLPPCLCVLIRRHRQACVALGHPSSNSGAFRPSQIVYQCCFPFILRVLILYLSLQHFESSGVTLMADGQYSQSRVNALLEYIQEREIDLEDLAAIRRIKLEQCIQLCQFESDATQVSFKALLDYVILIQPLCL